MLDVGCGVGRMAVPLKTYLSPAGRYEGYRYVNEAVDDVTGFFREHL